MVGCCVFRCTNRSSQKSKLQIKHEITGGRNITFNVFPKDPARKLAWINAVRRENWKPTESSVICSAHFLQSDYDKCYDFAKLKSTAVPSVFATYPSHLQKKKKNRKLPTKRIITPLRKIGMGNDSTEYPTTENDFDIEVTSLTSFPATSVSSGDMGLSKAPSGQISSPSRRRNLLIERSTSFSPVHKASRSLSPTKAVLVREISRWKQKVKVLQQRKRRQGKQIASLKNVLTTLKKQFATKIENIDCFEILAKGNVDLLRRQVAKKKKRPVTQKYSAELRTFAVTLHYYSPAAYRYVRNQFDTCLPHPKTISKWYKTIDAEPGFSSEALQAVKMKAINADHKIYCALVFDEMSIRRQVEYDGKQYHGFVDMGSGADMDGQKVAKEAIVFMLVSINGNWKVPVGYFLAAGLNAEQKLNLIHTCLNLVHETGVRVISITFDGLSTNFSLMTNLGCNINSTLNMQTFFRHPVTNENVYVFPDPPHMLKLVRNTLADGKILYNDNNNKIEWQFFEKLHDLQEKEGLHLANKMRAVHINFKNQKMKVRLATQLLSRSIAKAFIMCKDVLQLQEFQQSESTIQFVEIFNNLFDILNSKSIKQFDLKQPILAENCEVMFNQLNEIQKYIFELKCTKRNTDKIIYSKRRTGFLGFMICIQSLKQLIKEIVLPAGFKIFYIPTYKLSQDHVELFFGAIRAQGGYNNNPTARQFKAAFKKLLIHTELKDFSTGNCVPLEYINILHCSSSTNNTRAVEIINASCQNNEDQSGICNNERTAEDLTDHICAVVPPELTEFSKQIISYISGFVVRKLLKVLKCEECVHAILQTEDIIPPLIFLRDYGGLKNPSDDVITVCMVSESVVKTALAESGGKILLKKFSILYLVKAVMKFFIGKPIFVVLEEHVLTQISIENHILQLIRAVSEIYINVRMHYIAKRYIDSTESKRHVFNKLVLFLGT